MTLLFINTLYYPNQMGGAEVSVQLLAESFAQQGHKVFVISLHHTQQVKRINGVIAIYVKIRNIYGLFSTSKSGWKRLFWHLIDTVNPGYHFALKTIIQRIQPDVINTNNLQGFSVFTWRIIRRLKIPIVHTFRDYYLLCHRTTLYKNGKNCDGLCLSCKLAYTAKKPFTQLPDAFVGISKFILNRHRQMNMAVTKPGYVIPNIVAPPVNNTALTASVDHTNVRIGFIGRLTPEKGIDYLFGELAALSHNNYTLVLAGVYDESYKTALLQQFEPAGTIQFMGKTEAATFYNQVDLVVVPSAWQEPFGRVAVEAMAFNKPICIAANGGLQDIFEPECMWQFDMKPGSLSAVLHQILQNPQQLMVKAAACSRFMPKYSAATISGKYTELFNSLPYLRSDI
jgi:glycosyltransferase involved in cell wall biosynthesis